jgi:hypothetical protein
MYQLDNAIGYDNASDDHHQRLTCHVHCHGLTGNMLRDYHRTGPFSQKIKFPTEKDIETFKKILDFLENLTIEYLGDEKPFPT